MVPISNFNLLCAAGLLLVIGAISLVFRLGLNKQLGLAALRTVLQLALLGLVLEWVFTVDNPALVLALVGSMVVNASIASVRRTTRRYSGIWSSGLVAVTLSTVVTTALAMSLVVQVRPWHDPRYLIPLVGMILGNSLTGLSLCLEQLMATLENKRQEIEDLLCLGATAREAVEPHLRAALRTGLTPIINSMTVVGIVSIPGMMTGQVLAGASPEHAVRYQIAIMFMIAGATGLSALGITHLSLRRLLTSRHQLALYRLRPRDELTSVK